MGYSRIIMALSAAVLAWITADPAISWTRSDLHRHGGYYRYYPYSRHSCPWRHDRQPPYKETHTLQDGWDLIKEGQSLAAIKIFENISKATPAAGIPRLGIAIAASETGQLPKSVTAMRMALRYNPGAIQLFEPEDWLTDRLKKLVKKYQGPTHGLPDPDAFFMTAAFYYMLRDRAACLEAARRGRKTNDTSDSALNLFYMAEKDEWRFP